MVGTRSGRRWWLLAIGAVVVFGVLLMLAGVPATSPRVATTPGLAEQPPSRDRRPVQPVPEVRPRGFVDPPPGSGMSRYTQQKLHWQVCGDDLHCATALVPLDYRKPDGQAITLALTRRPASVGPSLGSLFINPGGPGGSGVEYVGFFQRKGLERYDIVGWDPRGVGRSTPVTCFDGATLDAYLARESSPDTPEEEDALMTTEQAFGRSCLERSGPLLEHVSTQETARDLDVLRGLVGDERLSYFGSSYGTEIGALYAELFPDRVGRMVLDGAVNITEDDSISQALGFERALGRFAQWCVDHNCRLGKTKQEVLQAIAGLWRRLDAKPISGGRRPLTEQGALTGVSYVLYRNEASWRYLLVALENAIVDNDGAYLQLLADQYYERDRSGNFGQSNYSFPAVRCLDSQDVSVTKALAEGKRDSAQAPTFGPVSGPDLVCPMWPVAPAPKQPTIDADGAPPIVVIGTTGDPATPYEYAVSMAKQLKSGVLVSLQGTGHLGYGQSACVQQIVTRYLVEGTAPRDGSRC